MLNFRAICTGCLCFMLAGSGSSQEASLVRVEEWSAPPLWAAPSNQQNHVLAEGSVASTDSAELLPSRPVPFVSVVPCRLVDTRGNGFAGPFGPPSLAAGIPRDFPVVGRCGVPPTAIAVSFNFTVTNTLGPGHLIATAQGEGQPPTSILNFLDAQTIANAAVVALGATGGITVSTAVSGANLIVDLNGYYGGAIVNTITGGPGIIATPSSADVTIGIADSAVAPSQLSSAGSVAGQVLVSNGSSVLWGHGAFFTGGLGGEVTGSQFGTVVSAAVASASPGTIVRRDADGSFTAGSIGLLGNLALPETAASGGAGVVTLGGVRFLHAAGAFPGFNVFLGLNAGNLAATGRDNIGIGFDALEAIAGGGANVAVGSSALQSDGSGSGNVATGYYSMWRNQTGSRNTALGVWSLYDNRTGGDNTAVGAQAMQYCQECSGNIAVGANAGYFVTGDHNIAIGHLGNIGESNTIRVGDSTQKATFIAGISGVTVPEGVPVVIDSSGHLGTTTSSALLKHEIQTIAGDSESLAKLRPVSFKYLPSIDPKQSKQYGLIAEEVAAVYPELVLLNTEGRAEAVQYNLLIPLVLSELQRQERMILEQKKQIDSLTGEVKRLEEQAARARRADR